MVLDYYIKKTITKNSNDREFVKLFENQNSTIILLLYICFFARTKHFIKFIK